LRPTLSPGKSGQHGVAAITAILIVAVAATAATMMLRQQAAMIDQASMVAARAQADLYAQAGVDWARGVLAEDARTARDVDALTEPWAQPIAALPVDRALVAGAISDEQGKLNLNNVVDGTRRSEPDMEMLRKLLALLGLAPELAEAVADWIDPDHDLAGNGGAEDAYYQSLARPYRAANRAMVQVEELYRVRGFDAKAVARLKPYVTAIDPAAAVAGTPPAGRTAVNVNTASDVVLAAMLGVPREKVQSLVGERRTRPFMRKAEFDARVQASLGVNGTAIAHDVTSSSFHVAVRVTQDEVHLASEALLRRGSDGRVMVAWRRPVH